MLNIIIAILFGIVEGISEWLPVSSTAHMMIISYFLPIVVSFENSRNAAFYDIFQVVIQLGAAIAILIYFWNKVFPFGKTNNPLGKGVLSYVKKDIFFLWIKIIIACIPAIIVGLFFDDGIFYNPVGISLALIIIGIAFIVVENIVKNKTFKINKIKDITYKMALYIGLFQVIAAIFPGTSRSGATIIGSLLLGISRGAAVEFTFCLAIPVMFGASLLKLIKTKIVLTLYEIIVLLVGMLSAFIVSVFVIKKLLNYIKTHDFKLFGYYRIILGILLIIMYVTGVI